MSDATSASARFADLMLTIAQHKDCWRAHVEEVDDPVSALSDSTDYPSPDRARRAAIAIAHELFGTNVPEDELEWRWNEEGVTS